MPELIEVELYRQAASAVSGMRVESIEVLDARVLRGTDPDQMAAALVGGTVVERARRGKLLLSRFDTGHVLGWRFGMTGRLIVGDHAPIERLEYAPGVERAEWNRFVLNLRPCGEGTGQRSVVVRVNDPRRLGSVELDPDESRLGPDALTVTAAVLRSRLTGVTAPIKAALLDQRRIAGLGNLLVDETLWRARIDPARPVDQLGPGGVTDLARSIRSTIGSLMRRGGSHRGDLQVHRRRGSVCPRCATPLERRTIAGRTTYSCPSEQL